MDIAVVVVCAGHSGIDWWNLPFTVETVYDRTK
jgi:hypothetical protein